MRLKIIALVLAVLASTFALAPQAFAFRVPAVTNQAALQECTACHMIFPPQMLPARSWTKLLATLDNHFNETATLDAAVRADILKYLVANAADAPAFRKITGLLAGVKATATPLRITDMPWWQRIHGARTDPVFRRVNITSAANCAVCHRGADTGNFQGG